MSDLEALIVVQDLDTRLDQLAHRRANLEQRTELARAREALEDVSRRQGELESRRRELTSEQKRLEDEVSLANDRKSAAEAKIYGGAVTNPRELQALQDEMSSLDRRVSLLEDEELEIMEQAEPVDADLAGLGDEEATLTERTEQLARAVTAAEAEIETEIDAARAERESAAAAVPDDLLAHYEALRSRLAGVGVARFERGICGGCHIKLSAVEQDRVRHEPADAWVHCEDCGRLLVR